MCVCVCCMCVREREREILITSLVNKIFNVE